MLATRGGEVRVYDTAADQREAAVRFVERELPALLEGVPDRSPGRIVPSAELADAIADAWLVVEAVPERLALKKRIFADLDRLAPHDAIFASNSSSYPTSEVIDDLSRRQRVVNTHFYMPP
jgi:3-hydroxybutyryl-CoA dehydrogenase